MMNCLGSLEKIILHLNTVAKNGKVILAKSNKGNKG